MILISFLCLIPRYSLSMWQTNLSLRLMYCKPLRLGLLQGALLLWLRGFYHCPSLQSCITITPCNSNVTFYTLFNILWTWFSGVWLVARLLTVLSAFNVVSSREAAKHPSSVEPPSHIPAKAAMLLWTQQTRNQHLNGHTHTWSQSCC